MPKIQFFEEDISYRLKHKGKIREWISNAIADETYALLELNIIFCSDEYLLKINRQFLKHDTYTDIITFDNSTVGGFVLGDIYISVERVKDNATKYNISETDEMHRVIIHGVLHLLGFNDKSPEEKTAMTEKEDYYLAMRAQVPNLN